MSDASPCDRSRPDASTPAPTTDKTRRRFLLAFGAGAAGAASASALAAARPKMMAEPARPAPESQSYRETEHVRTYYATTRI